MNVQGERSAQLRLSLQALSNWEGGPLYKKSLLAATFWALFIALDRLSLAFQMWGGTVAWYLPAGLTWALLLCGGIGYTPGCWRPRWRVPCGTTTGRRWPGVLFPEMWRYA